MIDIILVEPEHPGNVGSVARVMKNFGFTGLVLINPCCDIFCDEALKRSKHAQDNLKTAVNISYDTLQDYDYLVATTARLGSEENINRIPLTPSQFAEKCSMFDENSKVGLLIGRESIGLTNEEIGMCDFTVSIPANDDYNTLNISHALAVLLYELYKTLSVSDKIESITPPASGHEKRIIVQRMHLVLDLLPFSTPEKRETQAKFWKRLVGRSFLTKKEAYILLGFLRKVYKTLNKLGAKQDFYEEHQANSCNKQQKLGK